MKKTYSVIFFFLYLLTQSLYAQQTTANEYLSIDKKALEIPHSFTQTSQSIANYITSNFKSESEKARAIFIWVASNIRYDTQIKFPTYYYEKREDKIINALKNRKGICENYAALFTDICLKSGIKSYVIEGYTKQNGVIGAVPHAWSAAYIDNAWYAFDLTWASGYVMDARFYKKIDNSFYKVSPAVIINSHIPFDCIWQFLQYPITHQEFYEGKTQQNRTKPYFSFKDSIQVFEKQNPTQQWISSFYRIKNNGVKNAMISKRLVYLKSKIENDRRATVVKLYNSAVLDYNIGIRAFNNFIKYKNKQFMPQRHPSEIRKMIDTASDKLEGAKIKLERMPSMDVEDAEMVEQLSSSIDDVVDQVEEQHEWLTDYFNQRNTYRSAATVNEKLNKF